MFITVVEHNPEWKRAYEAEARHIRDILGNELINIFHIGSTSVPGLRAKPIIDIMPVVNDIARLDAYTSQFEALGYEVMGEFGMPGRRYFRKGGDCRTHNVHAFQFDNLEDVERHLAFREYLRAHAAVRDEYGRIKTALAKQYPADIDGYSDGKHDFVAETERDALKWRLRSRE